jgi:hypothetical protein
MSSKSSDDTLCVLPVLDAVYLNVVAEDWVNDVVEPVRVRNLRVQRQLHPLRSFRLKSQVENTLADPFSLNLDPDPGFSVNPDPDSGFLMNKNRKILQLTKIVILIKLALYL